MDETPQGPAASERSTNENSNAVAADDAETGSSASELPQDLPPVEPPSAGFIMQLFLVPGLIVAAVIGVWALFGKLSSSEQDWRQLVAEIRSNNEHRRWRGATGLAQMLRADAELRESGQSLSDNPQIAKELADLLDELLDEPLHDEELTSQQSFVARTLGWLDHTDVVLPALGRAMDAEHPSIVRIDAVRSVAVIASRMSRSGLEFNHSETTDRLIDVSQDSDPLVRQVCAYSLGLLPGDQVQQRLRIMTEDSDRSTRINAAIALARSGSVGGLPVLIDILKTAPNPVSPDSMEGASPGDRLLRAKSAEQMNVVILGNALKAVRDLHNAFDNSQRESLIALCEPIATDHDVVKIQLEASLTVQELRGASESTK